MKVLIVILLTLFGHGCGAAEDDTNVQREIFKDILLYKCICGSSSDCQPVRLSELLSDTNLVVFGSGACHACHSEMANLESIYQQWKNKNFNLISILINDDQYNTDTDILANFCCKTRKDYGFTFTSAIDPGAQQSGDYYELIPYNVILNKQREILYEVDGWNSDVIERLLKKILSGD